jgi:hypothetical protein
MRAPHRRRVAQFASGFALALVAACGSFKGTDDGLPSNVGGDGGASADGSAKGADGGSPKGDGGGGSTNDAAPINGKIVFVTSDTFVPSTQTDVLTGGNAFKGAGGADLVCQTYALASSKIDGTSSTFKAWISSAQSSPASSFTQSSRPYVLVDGTVVAANWAALTSSSLAHGISLDEDGNHVGATAWTATNNDGTFAGSGDCADWVDGSGVSQGYVGSTTDTSSWTTSATGQTAACNVAQHIFCFEQ